MLRVCWKIIKIYNKLTQPLRTGIFYILLRTKTSNLDIWVKLLFIAKTYLRLFQFINSLS